MELTNNYDSTQLRHVASQHTLADRVWALLQQRSRAAEGRPFIYSHRRIASDLGARVEGVLPHIMRALEAAGRIVRQSLSRGCTIQVIDQIDHDRSIETVASAPAPLAAEIPQPDAESNETPADKIHHDRSAAHIGNNLLGYYHHHHQGVGAGVSFSSDQEALHKRLTANPNMDPKTAFEIAQRLLGTVADFETDIEHARRRGKTEPFWFVVKIWLSGQRVSAPQEKTNARRTARTDTEYRGNSAGRAGRSGGGAAHQSKLLEQPATVQTISPKSLPTRGELKQREMQQVPG